MSLQGLCKVSHSCAQSLPCTMGQEYLLSVNGHFDMENFSHRKTRMEPGLNNETSFFELQIN